MYRSDLTPHPNDAAESPAALSVGWLSAAQPFERGLPDPALVHALEVLGRHPANWSTLTGGLPFRCEFCKPEVRITSGQSREEQWPQGSWGWGEIHVRDNDGVMYIAPRLISHYVSTHGYKPPQPFIQSALNCAQDAERSGRAWIKQKFRIRDWSSTKASELATLHRGLAAKDFGNLAALWKRAFQQGSPVYMDMGGFVIITPEGEVRGIDIDDFEPITLQTTPHAETWTKDAFRIAQQNYPELQEWALEMYEVSEPPQKTASFLNRVSSFFKLPKQR